MKAIAVITLECLYCKIPREVMIDNFYVAYDEYSSNPNKQLEKYKDFFVLKDKSIFKKENDFKIPTSPKWARGIVRNLMK